MKKISLLFFLIFTSTVFAETVSDFTNMCAATGYKRLYAIFPKNEYTCLPGYFLPADAETCAACPNGYTCDGGTFNYNATNAQGLTKTSPNSYVTAENACAANTIPKRLYAIMAPITYTCPSGYFLPANSTECATCPNGYTCAGGNFPVNTTTAQGLVRNSDYIVNGLGKACALNQVHALNAVFTINSYDCAPGYYLVADAEECTICPAGSYCVGGTYTFNETTTQGIEPCPDGTISMAGAPACYPHILHIGEDIVYLKSTKLTTPSLNVGMDDGVFYANMTTTPTRMNNATDHYLKIEYDGMLYYVCDDSTYNQ